MASDDGQRRERVKDLIHKFDFSIETQASSKAQIPESNSTSGKPRETEHSNAEQSIIKKRISDENRQKSNTKMADERKGCMFQELPEQIDNDVQNWDWKTPIQISAQRRLLSKCSVDLTVTKEPERVKNKLIVLYENAIKQSKAADLGMKFVDSVDNQRKELPKDIPEQKEEFDLEKLQDELNEVTRLVLHLESAVCKAKEKIKNLCQQMEDMKENQHRDINNQLKNKQVKNMVDMLSKQTQTGKLLEDSVAQQDMTTMQPTPDKHDNTMNCKLKTGLDEIDSEDLNQIDGHKEFAVETHVTEKRKQLNFMCSETLQSRFHEKHADSKTTFIPSDTKAENKYIINVKEFKSDLDTESDATENAALGKDTEALSSNEVVVDENKMKNAHVETAKLQAESQMEVSLLKLKVKEAVLTNGQRRAGYEISGADGLDLESEQADEYHETSSSFTKKEDQNKSEKVVDRKENKVRNDSNEKPNETSDKNEYINMHDEGDNEAILSVSGCIKNHQRKETETTAHNDDPNLIGIKLEESLTETRSDLAKNQERNLDPTTDGFEQHAHINVLSLNESELRNESVEKPETVPKRVGTTTKKYHDFSGIVAEKLELRNKRKSEYSTGWNVAIRSEVSYAENTLHEIKLDIKPIQNRQEINHDIKNNLDRVTNEQKLDQDMHIKSTSEMTSRESTLIVSKKKKEKILTVRPSDDESKAIWGVARVGNELYILRDSTLSAELWLLKEQSMECLWKLRERPLDMAGDSKNQYLYIVCCSQSDEKTMKTIISVYDINESKCGPVNGKPKHIWSVYIGGYVTLSITTESNVLLTLMKKSKLVEYTYNGKIEKVYRKIKIIDMVNALHAVKQSEDRYVVCQGENRDVKHRVCILNSCGHLLKEFCLTTYSGLGKSVVPMHLGLGRDGSIIVAENRTGRVLQLNSDLTVANVLLTVKDGLRGPCRLHLDEAIGQLIVADNEHGWRAGKLLFYDI